MASRRSSRSPRFARTTSTKPPYARLSRSSKGSDTCAAMGTRFVLPKPGNIATERFFPWAQVHAIRAIEERPHATVHLFRRAHAAYRRVRLHLRRPRNALARRALPPAVHAERLHLPRR